MSNFDRIEEFEEFSLKQWIALGTKLGGLDVVKNIMRGLAKVTVEIIRRFGEFTTFTSPSGQVNLGDFWQIRKGLWFSDEFRDNILTASKLGKVSVEERELAYADLVLPANEEEFDSELSPEHIIDDVDEVLVRLTWLIGDQFDGCDGHLLNTEYKANVLRIRIAGVVFTVDVRWGADDGRWLCHAYRANARRWRAGSRAFSATDVVALAPAL